MDLTLCKYATDHPEVAARLAEGMAWTPPKNHATWCLTQRAPWEHGRTYYGKKIRWPRTCNCERNELARLLRKVEARRKSADNVKLGG